MPANAIVSSSTTLSEIPETLVCSIGKSSNAMFFNRYWTVPECVIAHGNNPSYAMINIPTTSLQDENAGNLAFNEADLTDFAHGNRVIIERKSSNGVLFPVFTGSISTVTHAVQPNGVDSLVITAHSDLLHLRNIYVVGSYRVEFTGSVGPFSLAFFQGEPAIFNKGGRPNRIRTQEGYSVFCQSDFNTQLDADIPDDSTESACYWQLSHILEYIKQFYFTDNSVFTSKWGWIKTVDSSLIELGTLGSDIDTDALTDFNNTGAQGNTAKGTGRKGRQISLEGLNIASALELVLNSAGAWSYILTPKQSNGTVKSELRAIPTRYTSEGVTLRLADGGFAGTTLASAVVNSATYTESSLNYANIVAVAGDKVIIEKRVNTKNSSDLEPAWSTERENEFKNYVKRFPDSAGLQQAYTLFPEVYSTFKIHKDYDFQAGTLYSGYPRAKINHAIEATLRSFRGKGVIKDFRIAPYPINIETANKTSSTWTSLTELNGLEVWDDGTIYLPTLRVMRATWRWTAAEFSNTGDYANMERKDLRFTVAIPCDHRFTACAAETFSGASELDKVFAGGQPSPDAARINPELQRLHYVDAGNLYQCWLRNGAWGDPESITGTTKLPDKDGSISAGELSNTVRDDGKEILAHAKKTLNLKGRLDKIGSFVFDGYLLSEFPVGTCIEALQGVSSGRSFLIRAIVLRNKFSSTANKTYCEIGF
jgi:hypothetical protein